MAQMVFFTNPGCSIADKQKAELKDAGNDLQCRDLATHDWTYETLLPFVRGRDPLHIMNSAAPDIKKGKIDPILITFEEALSLMIESPILIKGPLVEVDGLCIQGTNDQRLNEYLGNCTADANSVTEQKRKPAPSNERRMWDYWQNIS